MKNNYYKVLLKKLARTPSFMVPCLILLSLFIFSFIVFMLYDNSLEANLNNSFLSPNLKYIFGTNEYGQNFFVVIFIGIFNTLILSALVSFINLILGGIVGIIWGHSTKMDAFMIILKSVLDNIPSIFFYIIN